jgi:hypothetical protein
MGSPIGIRPDAGGACFLCGAQAVVQRICTPCSGEIQSKRASQRAGQDGVKSILRAEALPAVYRREA